jgi:endopolyphosphatase
MEWLNVQLDYMRQRGMKAIIIGHVPPAWTDAKMNWDES